MKILFIDTETTDLTKERKIIQIAYLIVENDKIIKEYCNYIKPYYDEKIESFKGYKIHQISTDKCENKGIYVCNFIKDFKNDIKDINCVIGHNLNFDIETINILLKKYNKIDFLNYFNVIEKECTYNLSKLYNILNNIVNEKKKNTLKNTYKRLFNKNIENVHDALIDVKMTYEIYNKLINKIPKCYLEKNNNGKYICKCGSIISELYKHFKTKTHLEFLKKNNINEIIPKKNNFRGSLSQRIKQIDSLSDFNNDKIIYIENTKYIYNEEFNDLITDLNKINSRLCGVFFDYLLKIIYSEYKNIQFDDKTTFIIRLNFEMNEKDYGDYYFNERDHGGYKYEIIKKLCNSYNKVNEYFIEDCILNIVHICLLNFISKKEKIQKDEYKSFKKYIKINNKLLVKLITNIKTFFELNFENKDFEINPSFTEETKIGSEADLIIDDNLLDIKTSREYNSKYNKLQLLGYVSLATIANYKINKCGIIDLYNNKYIIYNINNYTKEKRNNFYNFISNK